MSWLLYKIPETGYICLKECMFDSVTNYNYVGDTKVSVSIKKLCQQMHIKRDISIWNIKIILSILIVVRGR